VHPTRLRSPQCLLRLCCDAGGTHNLDRSGSSVLEMVVETCPSCSVQLKLGYSLLAPDVLEFHPGVHGAGVVLSAQQHAPIIDVDDAHGSVHVPPAAP
jgi:hypothetical protein